MAGLKKWTQPQKLNKNKKDEIKISDIARTSLNGSNAEPVNQEVTAVVRTDKT